MDRIKMANDMLKIAKELLANDPIDFSDFIINKDRIHVSSRSTSFANHTRKEFSVEMITDAMVKLKKVKAIAKKNDIKLKNYNKRLSELKGLGSDYTSSVKEYNKLFDALYKTWKKIEKKKDLFYPPLSDLEKRIPEYGDAIKLGWKIEKLFYRSNVLSRIMDINNNLDSLLRDLKYNEYVSISV